VPNKSTVSHLVYHFCDAGTLYWVASDMRKIVNTCITECCGHFPSHNIFFLVLLKFIFWQIEHVRNGLFPSHNIFFFWFYWNLFFDK
jgi:hypothetical protein